MSIYPDVPENSPYAKAIDFARIFGIMVGDENGNFNPRNSVARSDLCVIICNLFQLKICTNCYDPSLEIPLWVQPYYFTCIHKNLLSDDDNWNIGITKNATIEDLTHILNNAQNKLLHSLRFKSSFTLSRPLHDDSLSRSLCAHIIFLFCNSISSTVHKYLFDCTSDFFYQAFSLFKVYDWIIYFFDGDEYQISSFLHKTGDNAVALSQLRSMLRIRDAKHLFLYNPPNCKAEPIYHYTSLRTLDALSKPGVKFFLNNAAYLNDPQEGLLGLNILTSDFQCKYKDNKNLNSFLKSLFPSLIVSRPNKIFIAPFFIASFIIKKSDDLPMWVQYAENGTGCCLEFDPEQIQEPLYTVTYEEQTIKKFFCSVLTTLKEYVDIFPCVDFIQDPVFQYGHDVLMQGCYLYKDSSYSHENEVRIITFADLKKAKTKNELYSGEIFPRIYLETPLMKKRSPKIGLNFSSVILGPAVKNPEYIALSLAQRGYNLDIFRKSTIYFR